MPRRRRRDGAQAHEFVERAKNLVHGRAKELMHMRKRGKAPDVHAQKGELARGRGGAAQAQ
jgi:hypothetical protein